MVKQEEQRRYTRMRVALHVEVRLECGVLVEGLAVNMSLNGLLFISECCLPLGCPVRVVLLSDDTPVTVYLVCRGTVARLDEHGLAIAFDRLSSEHAEQLHHLIRYHVVPDTPDDEVEATAAIGNADGTYDPAW